MKSKRGLLLSWSLAALVVIVGLAYAAVQLKPTKLLLVKNPPGNASARTVSFKVSEVASSNTVVGDPTVSGAKLRVALSPGGDQCVSMPASGWTAISTIGFKYKDATLANGPVKVAQIKKTKSGTFQIKATLKGAAITVVPGNPTASYGVNFKIVGGDQYCSGSGTAVPSPNDDKTFKVVNDTTPGGCTTAACSPSGAFLDLTSPLF